MKTEYKKVKSIILILVEIFIVWQIISIQSNVFRGMFEETTTFNNRKILIRTSQYTDRTGHPIKIDDTPPYEIDSNTWAYIATNAEWCSGLGTENDPYLIEYVYIDGQVSDTCIRIRDSTANFTIKNCILRNGSYGISLNNVSNGEVNNTACSFNGYGIRIQDCNHLEIVDNSVNNNSWGGISLYKSYYDVSYNLIDGNDVKYNGFGIQGVWSNIHNNTITNNNISFNYGKGIYISGGDNVVQYNTVNNNEGLDGYGIECRGNYNDISYNDANYNEGWGIYVAYANNTLKDNDANYNKEAGIYLSGNGHDLSGNTLDGCGLYIESSDQTTMSSYEIDISNKANLKSIYYYVDKHYLRSSDFDIVLPPAQIILVNCSHSIIHNFDLNNVSSGISIHFSNNNSISGNNLNYNSLQGIYIRNGDKNNITDNDVTNGGSIYVKGGNCSILLNNVNNGGGITIDGDDNNVSENIVNYGYGITISGDNATVIENTISYCNSEGITIGSSNSELLSNTINNCLGVGIYLSYNTKNNSIVGNSINNNLQGISVEQSSEYNNISQNILKNNKKYGIYMSTSASYEHNNTIAENKMYGCGFGIQSNPNLNNLITNDTIDSTNLVNDKPLILYYHEINLDENNFTNAGQIILINCSNSVVENLNFNNGSVGITLYHCDEIEISDITSENNKLYGIHLYYTDNTIISNNNLNYNIEYGIFADNCVENIITENTINDNEKDGLYMYYCSDINSTSNSFVKNQFGITLSYGCTENYFDTNTIHNNTDFGLRVLHTSCDTNSYLTNSFINPTGINACDNGTANSYYHGNYWHDYTGKDANDDGIGDTPYHIDGTANLEDIAPIWWDPPVITVHTPLENSIFRSAPNYGISIDEGIADSIWYTLNEGGKIFISNLNGSIDQSSWNLIEAGDIKITFFANDSRGFIDSAEVNVIKRRPSEIPIELIILITTLSIGAAAGIAIALYYRKRTKG